MDVVMPSTRGYLASVAFLALLACGCTRASPKEETYTVDYYRTHSDLREAKLRACFNNPGELGASPNCINAGRAGELEGIGSLRNLPPMGLSTDNELTKGTASKK
jgi:hypothetical protein